MKKLFLYVILTLLVIGPTVIYVQPVEARHYIYIAENPDWQYPGTPEADNWLMYRWWNGQSVRWYADLAISFEVEPVINGWWSWFPELIWEKVTQSANADVKFRYGYCPGSTVVLGCTEYETYYYLEQEHASFLKTINVWINPSPIGGWSGDGMKSQIAHEIGHVYGLDEKYIEMPNETADCNPNETSIMDVVLTQPTVHCDNIIEPTALDNQNVRWYWGQTMYGVNKNDLGFTGVGVGTEGVWRWKDLAWAEELHQVGWWWRPTPQSAWVMYHDESMRDWVGTHFFTDDRTIYRTVNRLSYPLVTGSGEHIMCGNVWVKATGQFGNFRCSNIINLN